MSSSDLVLSATCHTHKGTPGYTNFAVRNVDAGVEFDSHAVRSCVLTVPLAEARRLRDQLTEWLRQPGPG